MPDKNFGLIDAMLYLRTPEEEMSGEWIPPTQAEIERNRARHAAYYAWLGSHPPRTFINHAFKAGFEAGIDYREKLLKGAQCFCGLPAIVGTRYITGDGPSQFEWFCAEHMKG